MEYFTKTTATAFSLLLCITLVACSSDTTESTNTTDTTSNSQSNLTPEQETPENDLDILSVDTDLYMAYAEALQTFSLELVVLMCDTYQSYVSSEETMDYEDYYQKKLIFAEKMLSLSEMDFDVPAGLEDYHAENLEIYKEMGELETWCVDLERASFDPDLFSDEEAAQGLLTNLEQYIQGITALEGRALSAGEDYYDIMSLYIDGGILLAFDNEVEAYLDENMPVF